jgi:hypothetical protein
MLSFGLDKSEVRSKLLPPDPAKREKTLLIPLPTADPADLIESAGFTVVPATLKEYPGAKYTTAAAASPKAPRVPKIPPATAPPEGPVEAGASEEGPTGTGVGGSGFGPAMARAMATKYVSWLSWSYATKMMDPAAVAAM